MSGQQDILKSFLVSLGFSVDAGGLRVFMGTLLNIQSETGKVAAKLGGVVVAAEEMVRDVTASYESLYYASKRVGATVTNIKSLEYASEQVGVKAETARAALESMAASIRTNPGKRSLMDNLVGRDTGKMDQALAMLELVKNLGKLPHFAGAQFAQMFGMDEQTFKMYVDKMPELEAAFKRQQEALKNSVGDGNAAAAASREYQNELKSLEAQIGVTAGEVGLTLMPAFKFWVGYMVNTAAPALGKFTSEGITQLQNLGTAAAAALNGDWITVQNKLLNPYWNDVLNGKRSWKDVPGDMARSLLPNSKAEVDRIQNLGKPKTDTTTTAATQAASPATTTATAPATAPATTPMRREVSGKIGGATAIPEGANTPEDSGDILMKAPPGDKRLAKTLSDIQNGIPPSWTPSWKGKSLGSEGLNWTGGPAEQPGQAPITISQQTDIHVMGNADPTTTAKQVGAEQSRINGDLVRNLSGAIR